MWMMAMWQGLERDSISAGNTKWLMIFVGVVAFSMLTQAIVVIVAAVAATKTQKRVLAIAEELRARATPIINSTEDLFRDTLPKIRTISDNLVDVSAVVKAKAHEFDATLTDVNQKTKVQAVRIDGMVTSALTATGALAELIHKGVRTPIVEVVGVVNGFKAGLDVLLKRTKPRSGAGSDANRTQIATYRGDPRGL